MAKFSNYKKDENEPQYNFNCSAHGCPLPGTNHPSTKVEGPSNWYCRFHTGDDHRVWNNITERIGEMMPLLRHAHTVKTCDFMVREHYFKFPNNSDYDKREDENPFVYSGRLTEIASKYIRTGAV